MFARFSQIFAQGYFWHNFSGLLSTKFAPIYVWEDKGEEPKWASPQCHKSLKNTENKTVEVISCGKLDFNFILCISVFPPATV